MQNFLNIFWIQMNLSMVEASDPNSIEEVSLAYENVKQVDCLDVSKEGTIYPKHVLFVVSIKFVF